MAHPQSSGNAINVLRQHPDALVQKAAAHALGDDIWQNTDARGLADAYLASIAELSLLDQIAKYALRLPKSASPVLIASAAVGDVVAEGDPKPVKRQGLTLGDAEPTKAAGIVILTDELVRSLDGVSLFENELKSAVVRACNASVIGALPVSTTVPDAGSPLANLRAGLAAAGPSDGYVVAAPAGDVAQLATAEACRGGMGIRGGTFVPGVEVVAIDGLDKMIVIPASRLAIWDGGLEVRSARHATVDMRDTPQSPAQQVSLFQTNSLGLLVERNWHLAGDAQTVAVGG